MINRSDPNSAVFPRDGGPDCPRCRNMRLLQTDDGRLVPCPNCANEMQSLKPSNAHRLDRYSSDLGRAKEQTLFNFNTTIDEQHRELLQACKDAAMDFAEHLKGWLVLYGSSGNGKSHLAAAVRNHVVEVMGKPAIYITAPDLLYMLRKMFNQQTRQEEGETFEDRLDAYRKAPVLILDDFGAERINEWANEIFFSILDYRYRLRLPTMITTNLDPHDVKNFDIRLVTRMTDAELCIVIENTEPNYRARSTEER